MRTTTRETIDTGAAPPGPRRNVVLDSIGDLYRDRLRFVLALLAQHYELHLVPGRPVETVATATLRPRYCMWMTAHPR